MEKPDRECFGYVVNISGSEIVVYPKQENIKNETFRNSNPGCIANNCLCTEERYNK